MRGFSPAGRRVWITGASSGLGEALAREFAARGARLGVFARRKERLEALRDELAAAGAEVLVQPGDVTDRARVEEAVREVEERFGGIDCAVLNAGVGDTMPGHRYDTEKVETMFRVNALGVAYGIGAVLPGMLERGEGWIVGMGSIAGVRGLPIAAPYSASKAALATFLESLRLDLRPRGIRVVTVAPGFIRTPMTARNRYPMPFLLEVDDAARRIVRALERGKRFVHFPKPLTLPTLSLKLLPVPLYDWIMEALVRRFAREKAPPSE